MSAKRRSVTIKLQSNMFDQIKLTSEKKGETISETIRDLITRGFEKKVYRENTELITRIVKEQIEQVMKPYVDFQSSVGKEQPQQKLIKPVDPRKLAICRRIS